MVIWHIHGALSWLYDNTDTLGLADPYLLTAWCRVLLEKLTSSQLVKKFPTFYATKRFIVMFTRACHLPLFWARSIQSINTWLFCWWNPVRWCYVTVNIVTLFFIWFSCTLPFSYLLSSSSLISSYSTSYLSQ